MAPPIFCWELNILSKETDSGLGFYTSLVFPESTLLYVIFNYYENWF